MKKISFILCSALVLFACQDYNEDNFDGYNDLENPQSVDNYEHTMTTADYTTIVTALKANKNSADSVMANLLDKQKRFSKNVPAETLVPYLLTSLYYAADVKSAAKITYEYDNGRDSIVGDLSTAPYILSNDDYKSVWGEPFATALTPAKAPSTELPKLLKAKYPNAKTGTYKVVEYAYSEEEPVTSIVEGSSIYTQNFEGLGLNANDPVAISGWLNADLSGNRTWQMKTFNSNFYAQASSNGSKEVNDNWLITQSIDLSAASNPYLTFKVKVGYYNASCLHIMVSSNFDGNQANIASSTWEDVTSKFTIPTEPASGYGADFVSSGLGSLTSYKGKKAVYIAFRYKGDDVATTKATTTYQIDDVKITEAVVGKEVKSKEAQYAVYSNATGAWVRSGSNILALQVDDYASMGLQYLTTDQAKTYLPEFLSRNVNYAQEGSERIVVYKTSATAFYADKFAYVNKVWTIDSFIDTKTDQFVRASVDGHKKWIYDPTLMITLASTDFQVIIDHVRDNEAVGNPDAYNQVYKNAEYYYGFDSRNKNISYNMIDRAKDNTFPSDKPQSDQLKFVEQRTLDGIILFLKLQYPNTQATINGVEQYARILNLQFYRHPNYGTRSYWNYKFKCIGDKEWEFVERESVDGTIVQTAADIL